MDVTSLAETWGTWSGFIGMAALSGYLGVIIIAAIALSSLVLVARQGGRVNSYHIGVSFIGYIAMTSIIIVLFQPHLFSLGSIAGVDVPGDTIQSQ